MIIQTYLYSNKVVVQLTDPTIFTTRNRVVYARPVTIYQGIDNPIQVIVKNQDQKPIDLTGYTMQADIQDPNNAVLVGSFPVTWANQEQGLGNFTIDQATVDGLEQRFYKLTFKAVSEADQTSRPIYIDDNFGVPLDLKVLPAYYQPAL